MRHLVEDDFSISYTNLNNYPVIIIWVLSEPLYIDLIHARVYADINQVRRRPGAPEEFIPAISLSSADIGSSDGFDDDPFSHNKKDVIGVYPTMKQAMREIEHEIERQVSMYL